MKIWLYVGKQPWAVAIEVVTGTPEQLMEGTAPAHIEYQKAPDEFFSSTLETGPRITDFQGLTSQTMSDWRVVDLGLTSDDAAIVEKSIQMILKQAAIYGDAPTYNKEGIACNFLPQPLVRQNPNEYFCSQVVVTALQSVGLFIGMQPALMSPNDCAEWLDKHLLQWQALRFKINEGVN